MAPVYVERMGTPLENYESIEIGARKDPDLKRSPERYFWGALYLAVAILFIGAIFYVGMPVVVRAVMVIALLGIALTDIVRSFSSSRL